MNAMERNSKVMDSKAKRQFKKTNKQKLIYSIIIFNNYFIIFLLKNLMLFV